MTVPKSRVKSKGHDLLMAAKSANPEALLHAALGGKDHDRIVQALASYLRRTNYSVIDLFRDAADIKERIAAAGTTVKGLLSGWTQLDRTLGECVALASIGQEKFIETTLHAFCEIDQTGVIVYANRKMLELDPNCIGQDLPTRFGKMASEVRQDMNSGLNRLRQIDLIATDGRSHPVLAEFGRFDSNGRSGGFAFLVDMKDAVAAEQKALEAAPYGMLKVDSNHCVVYANQYLLDVLGLSFEDVRGRDSRDFIKDKESLKKATQQFAERRKGRGGEYEISLTRPKDSTTTRVRVMSVPSYDAAGHFSGMLASAVPIDHEIARNEIARIVATQTNYKDLFYEIVKILRNFIPFDWVDLSLYTDDRKFAKAICQYPKDSKQYKVGWFEIPPYYQKWIDQRSPCFSDMASDIKKNPGGKELLKREPEMRRTIKEGRRALIALPVRGEGRIIGALSLTSKSAGIYDDATTTIMQKLALDQALQAVFNARERAEEQFISDLLKKISVASDHKKLAETIVTEIAKYYDFHNVSIFKINMLRGHFSLLAQRLGRQGGQRLGRQGGKKIPTDYIQSLHEGLLGLTYRRGKYVNLGDSTDDSEEAKAFKRVDDTTRSELCIPINLRGRLLWILNLEDPRRNAFNQPEIETLQRIVAQIDATIDHLFQGLVLYQVLQVFPEAVVLTNKTGNILLCNENAEDLFETKNSEGEKLSSFLSKPDLAAALSEQTSPPWKTKVRGSMARKRPFYCRNSSFPTNTTTSFSCCRT